MTRAAVAAGLCLLLASGAIAARASNVRAERCAATLALRRQWLVELDDAVGPGGFTRGRALEPGCALQVRVAVQRGSASAGDAVRVEGSAVTAANGLAVVRAGVHPVRRAGVLRRLRSRAAASIDDAFGRDAPLAKALLVAETKSLTPELRERYAAATCSRSRGCTSG
jgi:hypothetical protein